jgi:hypothetical protein
MRDKQRQLEVKPVGGSLLSRLAEPVGNIYGNFVKAQDQDYDLAVKTAEAWMPVPLDVVDLQLRYDDANEISLSWHLTAVEKSLVLAAEHSAENQAAFHKLQRLVLGDPSVTDLAAGGIATGPQADRQR